MLTNDQAQIARLKAAIREALEFLNRVPCVTPKNVFCPKCAAIAHLEVALGE